MSMLFGKTQQIKPKPLKKNENEYPFRSDPRMTNDPANMDFNPLQPFFKREGGMSLAQNNEIKTRNLEGFTGVNNLDFQSKRENLLFLVTLRKGPFDFEQVTHVWKRMGVECAILATACNVECVPWASQR